MMKATVTAATMTRPMKAGDSGTCSMKILLARQTVDTSNTMKKAIQNAFRFPCFGRVLVTEEMMIPASAGPQVAVENKGSSRKWFRFRTAP